MDEPGAGFAVNLTSLSSAQSASASVGDQVAEAPRKLSGASALAVRDSPGWQASQALGNCVGAWEQRLQALEADVRQISHGLKGTIDNYNQAESQVLQEIQNAAAGLDTPSAVSSAGRTTVGELTVTGQPRAGTPGG